MPNGSRIFVGNLPSDCKEREIEDIFVKYGKIKFCDIKGGQGPLYAFVEFEDERDAEDAVHGRDGYDFDGKRLRVEFTRGNGPRGGDRRGGDRFGDRGGFRGGDRGDRSYSDRIGGGKRGSRRTNFRVTISGLPPTGSWQDLKDHMREAGDVCFSDVFKDGTGVVEYSRYDDVKYALKKLDDTKFRSHEGETSYITVKEDKDNGGGGGGRGGRSASRSRSPAARRASPKYSPRRSRSRSRSPRSASRSRSRSRS